MDMFRNWERKVCQNKLWYPIGRNKKKTDQKLLGWMK